jgi:two-component system phosphate regulon sensor histidine kinase PhoR
MINTALLTSDQVLADALPDAVIVLDKQGHMLWWNQTASKLFAISDKKANQKLCEYLTHPDLNFEAEKECGPLAIELSQNPEVHITVALLPYLDNHFLLLAQDVTHVYHLEKMRQDFLANVSHELRTPLTVVHGYLETLLEQHFDDLKPWRTILNQMYHQSMRMERLVNDLLLLSRLEADTPQEDFYHKVLVPGILDSLYHDAQALSGSKHHINFDVDESLTIFGIEEELRSLFSNLIFNAIKYTPAQGNIQVRWFKDREHPCFEVIDTGIGIDEQHIPRLTERFYRVDRARSRASGGTGLGLAIVKHVLIRHRGTLEIKSALGEGSTFTCRF